MSTIIWNVYDGKYEKKFYNIFTKNGIIHGPCWPNAGTFHIVEPIKTKNFDGVIDGKDVLAIQEVEET